VDRKENLKMITKYGEIIDFHLMSSTLGYSRYHLFIYSKSKIIEDFLRVSITNGTRKKHSKIQLFEKDTNRKIKLCKVRSPETKGKDESANRLVN